MAPITEELAFRGLGCGLLRPFGLGLAIVGSAVLWALAHGLLDATDHNARHRTRVARYRRDSTIPGMILHGAFNIAGRGTRDVIRVSDRRTAAAAVAWVAFEHVWRYGDAHPLAYRLVAVPNFQAAHPLSRVTTRGKQERVLITAGPRSSTGYSLEIGARWSSAVVSRSSSAKSTDRGAQILYPYRLLVFPKIDKPVHPLGGRT